MGTAAEILTEAVRIVTGKSDSDARPSQATLSNRIDATMSGLSGPTVGAAATGTGKSLGYLAPAAYAASNGERTVISTESLALQSQIVDKDAPVVVEACEKITGKRPTVAVLKGFSNFSCTKQTVETAEVLVSGNEWMDLTTSITESWANPHVKITELIDRLDTLDPHDMPSAALTKWALNEASNGGSGDKFDFDGEMTAQMWDTVSIGSGDCVGADSCPFAEMCLPRKSKAAAAAADIVVTNHTMLGIQAAKGVPVVLGSRTLGPFDHVVVDEAHGLASAVRNQGSSFISGLRIHQAVSALKGVLDTSDHNARVILEEGGAIGDLIDHELGGWVETIKTGSVARLTEADNPLLASSARLLRWTKAVSRALDILLARSKANEIRLRRLMSRFDQLTAAAKDCSTYQKGTARWVETETPRGSQRDWPVVRYTPVDVSSALQFNIWSTIDPPEENGEGPGLKVADFEDAPPESRFDRQEGDPPIEEEELLRRNLNVTCVSATLPVSFTRDVGLMAKVSHHESPFDDAFANSVLFVPSVKSGPEVKALAGDTEPPRLNTSLHTIWAADKIRVLTEANGGSALVLAATAAAGKSYVEHLRRNTHGFQVLSQWDGSGVRNVTAAWKADPTSVLVGTRSLMTGVDAPGQTCSLVIVDRIPRAASNPVDDARVEKLRADADFDRWTADRFVYGGDASLLLEQAAGRLIRSANDSGMVAILDPRLLKTGAMTYPAPTRSLYLGSVEPFTKRLSSTGRAVDWLREHRESNPHL